MSFEHNSNTKSKTQSVPAIKRITSVSAEPGSTGEFVGKLVFVLRVEEWLNVAVETEKVPFPHATNSYTLLFTVYMVSKRIVFNSNWLVTFCYSVHLG